MSDGSALTLYVAYAKNAHFAVKAILRKFAESTEDPNKGIQEALNMGNGKFSLLELLSSSDRKALEEKTIPIVLKELKAPNHLRP